MTRSWIPVLDRQKWICRLITSESPGFSHGEYQSKEIQEWAGIPNAIKLNGETFGATISCNFLLLKKLLSSLFRLNVKERAYGPLLNLMTLGRYPGTSLG